MHCIFKAQKVIEFYTLSFKNPISKRKIELDFFLLLLILCIANSLTNFGKDEWKFQTNVTQKSSQHSFMPEKKEQALDANILLANP